MRREMHAVLSAIPPAKRVVASERVCALLERQSLWREARAVLLFAPTPQEIDVWPLAAAAKASGKIVALPRFIPEAGKYGAFRVDDLVHDIHVGHFGIREPKAACVPVALGHADLILVPGLAFSTAGDRLGRGKGYYDQLLTQFGGIACGVAFDEQIVEHLPIETHDARMDCIITPTRWIRIRESRDDSVKAR